MIRVFTLLISLFCALSNYGQNFDFDIDSFKLAARLEKDTVKIDHLIDIARYYYQKQHNTDSMIHYAQIALNESKKIKNNKRIISTNRIIGIGYGDKLDTSNALKYYTTAIKLAEKINDIKNIININNNLGALYGKLNQFEKSTYYFLESVKGYKKINEFDGLANSYKNLNVIFYSQKQYNKVLQYVKLMLELIPQLEKEKKLIIVASIHEDVAQYQFAIGKENKDNTLIEQGVKNAKLAIEIGEKIGFTSAVANGYYVLSMHANANNNSTLAIEYANKALQNRQFIEQNEILKIYFSLIDIALQSKEYKLAQEYIDTCKMYPNSADLINQIILEERQYLIYKTIGDLKNALASNEHLIVLKDSMMRIEVNKSINDLETKYQSEIKDAKIINLDKQEKIKNLQIRSLLISLIAIASILSLTIFLYRQKILKNKQQLIETELRLNRARMDPHFFFNALTSIQGIALKEQGKETSSMLSKFSRMMRKSLESTYNEWITLEDEISFLQEYIDLQKLRNKNPFDVQFEIDDKIEYYDQMIPSMILQPFVENAIEHGFKAMTTNGLIQIKFKNENNNLHIDIIDNGSFSIDQSKPKEFPSRATQITKDRLFLIESKMNQKTNLKIAQNNPLGGYHIQLILPIQLKKS